MKRLVIISASLLMALTVTGTANAAVRTGTIQDAQDVPTQDVFGQNKCGDYSTANWPDLAALTVAYNETGNIRATWTFYEGRMPIRRGAPVIPSTLARVSRACISRSWVWTPTTTRPPRKSTLATCRGKDGRRAST